MKTLLKATSCLTLSLFAVVAAHGQYNRTWVSGVGDDANPCTRTAPCKTFAGAIAKTSAGGEIDVLDEGGFGAITITKAITIDGGGNIGSILVAGTNGIVVSAGASDAVTIRNITMTGIKQVSTPGLTGILINQAGSVHVENCTISNFGQSGIAMVSNGTPALVVEHSHIRDNSVSGITVGVTGTTALVSVSDTTLENNGVGLLAKGLSKVTAKNVVASGNTGAGFQADASAGSTTMNISDSVAVNNAGIGVLASSTGSSTALVRLSNVSTFSNTGGGISAGTGGSIYSFGDNAITGGGIPTGTIAKQ